MSRAIVFILSICLLCASAVAKNFDWKIGNTTVWLNAASYCETNTYLSRTYKGYTSGFQAAYVVDGPADVQAIVGVMPSQSAIYVAFRGSTDIQDWLNNLDDLKTSYPYCSKCEVHKGFYKASTAAYPTVKKYIQNLLAKYPSYQVIMSGHSLGAAMATLMALDLQHENVVSANKLRMFNFGSPRIGNDEFAAYASTALLDHNRMTHHKDIVPHVPMHERFTHIDGEWYQPGDDLTLKECVGYEDKSCSYQWNLTSINDHMWYLTLNLACQAVS